MGYIFSLLATNYDYLFNWIRLLKFINWLEIGDKCKYTLSIDSQWITC